MKHTKRFMRSKRLLAVVHWNLICRAIEDFRAGRVRPLWRIEAALGVGASIHLPGTVTEGM